MAELEDAVRLASHVLDRPSHDPDDDLAVLARQFLRARERVEFLQMQAQAMDIWQGECGHVWRVSADGRECPRCAAVSPLHRAAPDLLEALKGLCGLAQQRGGHLHEYKAAVDDALAAIAKATDHE